MMRTLPHTEQFAIGYFTSAAGVTIYRGDAYPPEFRGNAFVGDVGGNLVHRKRLSRDGVLITARRADENTEFIASTDNWFRPVNFVNGPDGTLEIIDMYRETIEHPYSIPQDIKDHLDLQSGDNRGRIYRLLPPGPRRLRKAERLGSLASADLVTRLESTNAWQRETAQRLLFERQDRSVIPALEQVARRSPSPLGRLHALYTLEGLAALSDDLLEHALTDAEPRLRAHALRLCEPRLRRSPGLLSNAVRLTDDADALVRFQLALSLGEAPAEEAVEPLVRLARHVTRDGLLSTAILTSVANNAERVAGRLLHDDQFLRREAAAELLAELAASIGAQPDQARAIGLLRAIFAARTRPGLQVVMLKALGQGLSRHGGSMVKLIESAAHAPRDPRIDSSVDVGHAAAELFKEAVAVAGDEAGQPGGRASAIGLLAFAPYDQAAPVLAGLLTPQTPPALQSAAVAALSSHENRAVSRQLLAGWKSYGPAIRRDVIDALLHNPARAGVLFDAVESREVSPSEIDRDVKQLLINHPNPALRRRAAGCCSRISRETGRKSSPTTSPPWGTAEMRNGAARSTNGGARRATAMARAVTRSGRISFPCRTNRPPTC